MNPQSPKDLSLEGLRPGILCAARGLRESSGASSFSGAGGTSLGLQGLGVYGLRALGFQDQG